jgi:hypothetical protein
MAFDLREQRKRVRDAELAASLPASMDIVLRYWKVQPKRKGVAR